MNRVKIIVVLIWIHILSPILSYLINLLVFLANVEKVRKIQTERRTIKLLDLHSLLKQFKWKQRNIDPYIFFTPSIFTIFTNKNQNDIIGSATLAKYWYRTHNIPSTILYLFNDNLTIGHSICIKNDLTEFVSNSNIVLITPNEDETWMDFIYDYFNGEYTLFFELNPLRKKGNK